MSFAFSVYDTTGEPLGGGLYPELEGEAGFVEANKEFERIFPKREIHVEEISVEQYLEEGGFTSMAEARNWSNDFPDALPWAGLSDEQLQTEIAFSEAANDPHAKDWLDNLRGEQAKRKSVHSDKRRSEIQ